MLSNVELPDRKAQSGTPCQPNRPKGRTSCNLITWAGHIEKDVFKMSVFNAIPVQLKQSVKYFSVYFSRAGAIFFTSQKSKKVKPYAAKIHF